MSWLLWACLAWGQTADLTRWEPVQMRSGAYRLSGWPDAPLARIRAHLWQRLTERQEPDEVRAAVVEAWLRTEPSVRDQRAVWFASSTRVRQVMVVEALDAGWSGVIDAGLADGSAVVRGQAAAAVGRHPELAVDVSPLLRDPAREVRLAAVRALDLRGELDPLHGLQDEDPAVTAAVQRALRRRR